MSTLRYLLATIRRRPIDLLFNALAIALAVAFLASLGSFVSSTRAGMTARAAARVSVDWQVQVTPQGDPAAVLRALKALPAVTGIKPVQLATVPGLRSTSASGVRTTGQAYVVALPAHYAQFAPGQIRSLVGSPTGVVLQQQTAANLGASPGAKVRVLGGAKGATVRVGGVVDLPAADSFFQVVGTPAGAGASAPPDNVLIVPPSQFARLTAGRTVLEQFHVRFRHAGLPADPAAAAGLSTQRANHFAAAVAGGALVGDNLGAVLSAAREDALYAQLLFWLLGVPGLVLAGVVTALVVALRAQRQRRELALLRIRGATPARLGGLIGSQALLEGGVGVLLGLGGAVLAVRWAIGPGAGISAGWALAATILGLALALLTRLAPVARLLRRGGATVGEQVSALPSNRLPLPLRLGLDVICLAGSAIVLLLTARGGYQVVVVPEGIPVASVNYAALLAPALAWPGLALLTWRITSAVLARRHRTPTSDATGRVSDLRGNAVRRRRQLIARGATGLAVALGLTVSTAVFTATYDKQAKIDVALTVGSDVAVTVPPDSTSTRLQPAQVSQVAGVRKVEPMLHRLAYVGPDLQDLYGINPRTIGEAAPMLDAFTPGTTIAASMAALAATPRGVLLSQETLHDYQLHPGDSVTLRLKAAKTGGYAAVPFKVVGVITEFATAPRDSFIVANRGYIAGATGSAAVQTLLVRTDTPAAVAARVRTVVPTAASVTESTSAAASVTSASGLAATDLSGLSRLELGFGLLLALASSVLALLAGIKQRQRSLTTLALLGASSRQRAGFLWTEARGLMVAGALGGLLIGAVLAYELVKVLTGIFDPAPSGLTVPVAYLSAMALAVLAGSTLAVVAGGRYLGRADMTQLRDL